MPLPCLLAAENPHSSDGIFFAPSENAATPGDESAVRAVIEGRARAIGRKDADAVIACNAPGMLSFGLLAPLRQRGATAMRQGLEHWFAAFHGPLGCKVRELGISTDADTASANFLHHFSGINAGGAQIDLYVRVTMGLQRIGGRWLIVHEHVSDPLGPDDGTPQQCIEP